LSPQTFSHSALPAARNPETTRLPTVNTTALQVQDRNPRDQHPDPEFDEACAAAEAELRAATVRDRARSEKLNAQVNRLVAESKAVRKAAEEYLYGVDRAMYSTKRYPAYYASRRAGEFAIRAVE
jgi:hypothetical protein